MSKISVGLAAAAAGLTFAFGPLSLAQAADADTTAQPTDVTSVTGDAPTTDTQTGPSATTAPVPDATTTSAAPTTAPPGPTPESTATPSSTPTTAAPTPSTTPKVTGTWTNSCKDISVTGSGPEGTQIYVRWYAAATGPTPGVDGEAYVPADGTAQIIKIDNPKVRGFSFRLVDRDGNLLTPLRDQAASCVVLAPPPAVAATAKDCDTITVTASNLPLNDSAKGEVRLVDETGKVVKSIVATKEGTWDFDVPPGKYVAKAGYVYQGTWYDKASADVDMSAGCPTTPDLPAGPGAKPSTGCPAAVTTGGDGKVYDASGSVVFERYIDRWFEDVRVGAGTTVPLHGAVLTITYTDEAAAKSGYAAISDAVTPGWGAVHDSLRTAYVLDTGTPFRLSQSALPMHVADVTSHAQQSGKTVQVTIGDMPAGSSFSANMGLGVASARLDAWRDATCSVPTAPAPTDGPTTTPTTQPTTPTPGDGPTGSPTVPTPTGSPTVPMPTGSPTVPMPTQVPTTPAPTSQPTTPAATSRPTAEPTTPAPTRPSVPTDEPTGPAPTASCPETEPDTTEPTKPEPTRPETTKPETTEPETTEPTTAHEGPGGAAPGATGAPDTIAPAAEETTSHDASSTGDGTPGHVVEGTAWDGHGDGAPVQHTEDTSAPSAGELPYTGADIAVALVGGIGLLGVGTGLILWGRRRSA